MHRDVRAPNVILANGGARLIDFSHAGFRCDMVPPLWEKRMEEDYELLDRIFKEAERRMVCCHSFSFRCVLLLWMIRTDWRWMQG